MKETTKQNIATLIITILIGSLFFIFINYFKPTLNTLKDTLAKIEITKQKIDLLNDYQNKFNELKETYHDNAEKINQIDLAIPNDSQTGQALAVLDAISKNTGVTPSTIFFATEENENYGTLRINMTFVASYDSLKKWIQEIEKEIRLIDLNNIDISTVSSQEPAIIRSGSRTSTQSNLLNCTANFLMYYQI